jgi:hypothetical protein
MSVPVMNPSCTAEVTIPTSFISTFIADCKPLMIAFPANQREVQANCEKIITGKIRLGTFIND